jgi:hypothetical protein
MRKRNPGLVRFARERGAIRKDGSVDWYRVAEFLAKEFASELLESSKGRGRPRAADNWPWLVDDVIAVMQARACSEFKACKALTEGEHPHRVMVDGRPTRLASNKRWKGMKARTLYRRYREQIRMIRQKRAARRHSRPAT